MIPKYDLTVPPDMQVFIVVYRDPELGALLMPEAYYTQKEARFHWRFNRTYVEPEEMAATFIVETYYFKFITQAYGYSSDRDEMYRNADFLVDYETKWTRKQRIPGNE
jgi:hypothetical protein